MFITALHMCVFFHSVRMVGCGAGWNDVWPLSFFLHCLGICLQESPNLVLSGQLWLGTRRGICQAFWQSGQECLAPLWVLHLKGSGKSFLFGSGSLMHPVHFFVCVQMHFFGWMVICFCALHHRLNKWVYIYTCEGQILSSLKAGTDMNIQ